MPKSFLLGIRGRCAPSVQHFNQHRMMQNNSIYDIESGPSWADLKEASVQGQASPHRPNISFTVTERDSMATNPEFRVINETFHPIVRLIGAEDASGLRFALEIANQGEIWHGFYDTKTRRGWLRHGELRRD